MKSKKFKFIIGTLIIALVISVSPIGLVANADKGKVKVKDNKQETKKVVVEKKVELVKDEEAIKIAREKAVEEIKNNDDLSKAEKKDEIDEIGKIKKEDVKINLKNNVYYIEFSTGIYKYLVNVSAKTGEISYYNEVLIVKNDSNLKRALKAAYEAVLDEEDKEERDTDYEDIKIVKINSFLDAKEPYYIFQLKTKKYLYEIKVIQKDFKVEVLKQTPLKEEKDEDEDEDKKEALRPNELNQILNAVKKEAIEEFKNAKKGANKEDKKQAVADFKANKDLIKFARKTGITDYLDDLKTELNKKSNKPINQIKNLTKDQVEDKAREKINARGLKLESIVLKPDNIPPFYLVKMDNDNYSYELLVHSTTGAILEYLRVAK